MLKLSPMEKTWFMAPWNKAPMENAIWLQQNMSQWLTDPVKKAMFCERVFSFEGVIVMLKDKKIQFNRYNVNKNQFYALH